MKRYLSDFICMQQQSTFIICTPNDNFFLHFNWNQLLLKTSNWLCFCTCVWLVIQSSATDSSTDFFVVLWMCNIFPHFSSQYLLPRKVANKNKTSTLLKKCFYSILAAMYFIVYFIFLLFVVILLVISVDRQPTNKKGGGSRPLAGTWGLVWQAGLCCRQADGALCRADSGCCAVSCSLRAQWVCRCGWQSECLVYSVTTALVKIHCAHMQLAHAPSAAMGHLCVLPGRAGTGAALPNRRCSVQAAHRPRLLPKPLISCFHSYLLWLLMFTVLSQT